MPNEIRGWFPVKSFGKSVDRVRKHKTEAGAFGSQLHNFTRDSMTLLCPGVKYRLAPPRDS